MIYESKMKAKKHKELEMENEIGQFDIDISEFDTDERKVNYQQEVVFPN